MREGFKKVECGKKVKLSIILLFIVTAGIIAFISNKEKTRILNVFNNKEPKKAHNLIVIDPGHGGFDPGAVFGKIKESVINLEIAKRAKEYFEMFGFKVILTRYNEDDLSENDAKAHDLKKRKQIVLENEPEVFIFISIHLNSFRVNKYLGAQVFYEKSNEEAKKLASWVQNELKYMPNGLVNKRMPKPIDVYMLRGLKIPAILVECGFMSNQMELSLLQTKKYQDWLSYSILKGVLNYLDSKGDVEDGRYKDTYR
ncbi:N-acetylmuramoyl-L-alanine amidase [Caldicellulosiruptor naganoensis]|uniref:N-acetylmuramoyl-L-alanine amidase n=1 Tax=Caldicellulosiruptor naganoensis TaxID=29324 RepID=A0ABY7BLH0_9FIRM|nr:N-acetylmuramoyl-L-alanine amidase [Caldicellulosiruptor naganoensis]WAM31876.1 N-acetylmuramoyl-L-alanine amidase [Caldicellulosiruptor naganoensis]